jgi:hypothetical protein
VSRTVIDVARVGMQPPIAWRYARAILAGLVIVASGLIPWTFLNGAAQTHVRRTTN